ncbi:hypothetical protein TrST_g7020 [Triparma strigata]|uniref:Uroporphyrinogen decarboxylase n=1 Tax=Triparma strigata TaxID=1606541 RepID=A0A9W7AK10_9STRA|nr:hypothetical protein TrST_g7020 [Triparma strigata]
MKFLALLLSATLVSTLLPSLHSFSTTTPSKPLLAPRTDLSIAVPPPPTLDVPEVPTDHDILLRAARGEVTERTPLWMMRQAGRYMKAFRAYSENYPFRVRSETPSIAVELSLQCVKAYGLDGCIMFSDILTPLSAIGIEWDVIKGKGPVVYTDVTTEEGVDSLTALGDVDEKLPFLGETLRALRGHTEGKCTLLGFVGSPWTLSAYAAEGGGTKDARKIKHMMYHNPDLARKLFDKLAVMAGEYAVHQIDSGAQVIQVFESWAHHLSPADFEKFAKPAAKKTIEIIKKAKPDTPVIYFANGGSAYLDLQRDMGCDMVCVDHQICMAKARSDLGADVPVSGNVDPSVLFGTEEQIRQAVRDCVDGAGGPGNRHVMNLGHGVRQGTPEESVGWAVDEVKRIRK